jgi:phospholipid transport system substrate-binding protein
MKVFMMNSVTNITRRSLLLGASALAVVPASSAFALNEAQASRLINAAVNDINSVINSGKSQNAMFNDFEKIFYKYADVSTIARSALGPPARSASNAEMKSFTAAFTGYLSRKYGKRFREFIGGKIEVTGARSVKSFQEVKAVAILRGKSPFDVSFMVSDRSGSDKFFDLLIEGISLLKSEKAEIGAMLDRRRGDIGGLIQDLQKAG